jgi:hypothetical protein
VAETPGPAVNLLPEPMERDWVADKIMLETTPSVEPPVVAADMEELEEMEPMEALIMASVLKAVHTH